MLLPRNVLLLFPVLMCFRFRFQATVRCCAQSQTLLSHSSIFKVRWKWLGTNFNPRQTFCLYADGCYFILAVKHMQLLALLGSLLAFVMVVRGVVHPWRNFHAQTFPVSVTIHICKYEYRGLHSANLFKDHRM